MIRRKRPIWWLLISLFTFFTLAYIVYALPPQTGLTLGNIYLSIVYLFFVLVFLFLFAACTYIFKSNKHALLISTFVLLCLLFLLNNLTSPLFFVLLAALFLVLELLVIYGKRDKQV